MSFLSFEMTELHQNIFDTVILEHPVDGALKETIFLFILKTITFLSCFQSKKIFTTISKTDLLNIYLFLFILQGFKSISLQSTAYANNK